MEEICRMVRQFIYLLFVIIAGMFSASCHRNHPFVLEGEVKDGGKGTVYLYRYGTKNYQLIDSVCFADGRFHYEGEVGQPLLYGISVRKDDTNPQTFFVGEDTLHLSFWKTGREILAQNSPLNDAYLAMRERARGASEQAILRYVHDNPASPVTAFFALHDWSWRLDLPTLRLIYNTIEPSLKTCLYVQQLKELMENMEQVQPGKTPPAINGIPAEEQKQTVLVFFATWCPDCQVEMPEVRRMAIGRKDLRFVGISLDTQKRQLELFKQKYKAVFQTVVSDYQGWESPVVRSYAVRWIPTFFLISPEGKVLKSSHGIAALLARDS